MTTKVALIMALHAEGKTTRQIAEAVYGNLTSYAERDRKMAYVRVALRQRKNNGKSKADRAYDLKQRRRFGHSRWTEYRRQLADSGDYARVD